MVVSGVREVWRYRELLKNLTSSKLKIRHKRTKLGYIWWLLDPLLFMGIYYLIVQVIFQRGGPDYPIFLFIGLLSWRWFSSTISEAASSIRAKGSLIKQIYFPKATLVLSAVYTNTINYLFGLVLLAGFILLFNVKLSLFILFFPLVMVVQLVLGAGIAFIVAHLTVYFSDLENLLGHLLRIAFYLSPGIYAVTLIPEQYRTYYMLNPFAQLFTAYRDSALYGQMPDLLGLLVVLLVAIVLVVLGFSLVLKHQGRYAKVL